MIKLIQSLLIIIALTIHFQMNGQDSITHKIEILGRAQENQITLRWAPNSPDLWQLANKHGMKLERYTILRNGKALTKLELKTYPELFKPLPLADWEQVSENDDFALVAAQAIYGNSFEVTENMSSDITRAINETKELEQRHLFALFAADQSKNVAKASGLMFEDTDVKENEKYLYTISCSIPSSDIYVDTSSVFIGLEDYFELPAPTGVSGEIVKENIILSWEARRYADFYNSYIVERSDDGGNTFFSITETPIVTPLDDNGKVPEYVFKGDTIQELKKKYIYRVKGINPFGEISQPSDTISITAYPGLHVTPHISKVIGREDGAMQIYWEFPAAQRDSIKGFNLKRAGKINDKYEIIKGSISPRDSTVVDASPLPSNYYIITAYDEFGNESTSLPFLGLLEDSIPPAAPIGLTGSIDTAGVVHLHWEKNTEADLIGYKVFTANFSGEEFIQITNNIVSDTLYSDTVILKTLTHSAYYKISAMDGHFNSSSYSVALKLSRPDIIPPATAQFYKVANEDDGIHLEWNQSSSDDVKSHSLYRKTAKQSGWKNIQEFNGENVSNSYVDKDVLPQVEYAYILVVTDSTGNESPPSKPVSIKSKANIKVPIIEQVKAKKDYEIKAIVLTWEYDYSNVRKYLIYRSKKDESPVLFKEVDGDKLEFIDKNIKENTKYQYHIQVALENGALSKFSKKELVSY